MTVQPDEDLSCCNTLIPRLSSACLNNAVTIPMDDDLVFVPDP